MIAEPAGYVNHSVNKKVNDSMTSWKEDYDFEMFGAEESFSMNDIQSAIKYFNLAIEYVPEPRYAHYEYTRALSGIMDCYFALGEYVQAEEMIMKIEASLGGQNGFTKLRKGQIYYKTNRVDLGHLELLSAYMLGGQELFQQDQDAWALIANDVDQYEK